MRDNQGWKLPAAAGAAFSVAGACFLAAFLLGPDALNLIATVLLLALGVINLRAALTRRYRSSS